MACAHWRRAARRVRGDRAPARDPEAEFPPMARLTVVHAGSDRAAIKREVARLIGTGRYMHATDQLIEWTIG